jgi:hypothetical protein
MTRIKTDQPSSGKPLQLFIPNAGFVPSAWTTLVEAPDFSVPASGDSGQTGEVPPQAYPVLDPGDPGRELRPGEVFLEAPLTCTNQDTVTRWVELRIYTQTNHAIPVGPQISIPAKEAIYVPIQGLRLLKTSLSATNGDRLQIRASVGSAIKVIGSAVELEALTHAPDSEA